MRFDDNEEKKSNKFSILLSVILGLFIIVLIGYKAVIKNIEAGYYVMIEPISGQGSFVAKMEPGRYFLGANKEHVYDKSGTFWFSHDLSEGEDRDCGSRKTSPGGTAGA